MLKDEQREVIYLFIRLELKLRLAKGDLLLSGAAEESTITESVIKEEYEEARVNEATHTWNISGRNQGPDIEFWP